MLGRPGTVRHRRALSAGSPAVHSRRRQGGRHDQHLTTTLRPGGNRDAHGRDRVDRHARADGGGGGGGDDRDSQLRGRPEDLDYAAGVRAIKAERFAEAIPLLQRVVGRDGRNAYNWLAYATRRNGNPAASLPLYEKALTIDPRHRGAHEYRDLKKAVEQYEKAVEQYEKTGKVSATH